MFPHHHLAKLLLLVPLIAQAAPDPRQYNLCGQIARGRIEEVCRLLEQGASPETGDSFGKTPLTTAAHMGNSQLLLRLLQAGARINNHDAYGRTALHEAARVGHLGCIRILLQHGADPQRLDRWGRTALELARIHGHTQVADYMSSQTTQQKQSR